MQLDLGKTPAQRTKQRGFTLVELLIVIVVIAILAAITIIAYNGVTGKAHAVSLQSDLKNAATVLGISKANNGQYPADLSTANSGRPLNASSGNIFSYNVAADGSSYCLNVAGNGLTYSLTSDDQVPQVGFCNGGFVTTLAGNGTNGFANGTGSAAEFGQLSSIAVDTSGNAYVTDGNNCIRKVSPVGVVTTLAGTCAFDGSTAGDADGTGAAAQFYYPGGVSVDNSGNVYVADGGNCIRKITQGGVVTTLAGTCAADGSTFGYAEGTGPAAKFKYMSGTAVDASGNVYVSDYGNERIRKITPSGVVSTLAGDGTRGYVDGAGTAAEFSIPGDVAVDTSGNVYVADTYNNRIRKITPAGVVSTVAGNGTFGYADGIGAAAEFNNTDSVAVDSSGNIYVVDGSSRIRKITPAGVVTTLAGNGTAGYIDGTGTAAEFNNPAGIAADSSGNLYIADWGNHRIRVIK